MNPEAPTAGVRASANGRLRDNSAAGPDEDMWAGTDWDTTTWAPADDAADVELVEKARALVRERFPALDWVALWATEDEDEDWILEPLLPKGRLVSLYSAPKLGKSLLALEIAAGIACGRAVLGLTPRRPFTVLYADLENDPRADVRSRLTAMGYSPGDLGNLAYLSFPTLAALDSRQGAQELLAAVDAYGAEVVVIDTVSRTVAGEENSNDTWLAFYRFTGLALKKAGVTLLRLDHSGKDATKGQRGGSAKSGDVDAVWRLTRDPASRHTFRLECTDSRMLMTEQTIVLHRQLGPLRHAADAGERQRSAAAKFKAAVAAVDAAGLPNDASNAQARRAVRDAGLTAGNDLIAEVVRVRKGRADGEQLGLVEAPGDPSAEAEEPFRKDLGTVPSEERSATDPERPGTEAS